MPDLIFTIKTPAELEGAERAAQALEVSIGKAKGLSKEYAALETQLKSVQTSIEAFKAAQSQTATAPAEVDPWKPEFPWRDVCNEHQTEAMRLQRAMLPAL